MFPASNSSFCARSTLRFQRAALAFRTPITIQLQAFFNVGVAPDQRLASWTNVFVFCRVIDEGIVIETPVGLGSRGPGERLTTTVCLLRRWALPDCATCRWLMFTLTRYCCRCVPVPCTLIPGKPATASLMDYEYSHLSRCRAFTCSIFLKERESTQSRQDLYRISWRRPVLSCCCSSKH
jgi:hypothetical protein